MEIIDLTTLHPARSALAEMAESDNDRIDIIAGAMLIAAEDLDLEPDDVEGYIDILDKFAACAKDYMPEVPTIADRIAGLHQAFFIELDMSGEGVDVDDPMAVLLPTVLDTSRGIPISLSLAYIAVANRLCLCAHGIAFPGHFLVRIELEDGIMIVDPFNGGRTLDIADCEALLEDTSGKAAEFELSLLEPAGSRVILMRILSNLRASYLRRSDEARALAAHERMIILNPRSTSLIKGRADLLFRLGNIDGAISDLERVISLNPPVAEAMEVRRLLARLRRNGRWIN